MCSSKHLDRTRSGPGLEQIRRVNSIYVSRFVAEQSADIRLIWLCEFEK